MAIIRLQTSINALVEVCFDLRRSIDMHVDSMTDTDERVVDGRTSGLMEDGETVTWEATHFAFGRS